MFPRWGQEKVINVFIYHDNTHQTIITFCPHKLSLKIYFRIAVDGSFSGGEANYFVRPKFKRGKNGIKTGKNSRKKKIFVI